MSNSMNNTMDNPIKPGKKFRLPTAILGGDISPDGKPLKYVPLLGGLRSLRLGLVFGREGKRRQVVQAFVDHCRELIHPGSVPGMTMD